MAFSAYFDESGVHQGASVCVVAGFLADDQLWTELSSQWKTALDGFELTSFHAVDCEQGQGEFLGKRTEPIRKFIHIEFARLIAKLQPTIVASAFVIEDWNNTAPEELQKRFPSAYMFCFEFCMQKLSNWSKAIAGRGKVNVVFAEQNQYESKALEMFGHYERNSHFGPGLGTARFQPMRNCPALQAADLLCYETYRRGAAGPSAPLRPVMEELLRGCQDPLQGLFDSGSFQMLIENGPAGRLY